MREDLIYDVGLHNGDDTAFYLHRGYDVIAVEADPSLIAAARERFAKELDAGRLSLVHAGIADRAGSATFFLCEGKSEFNSFDRANATKQGHACREIEITCRTFASILEEFGTPHYLKIDIEKFDRHCVADLNRLDLPRFLSCELTDTDQIEQMAGLGYDAFKLVWQGHHRAVEDETRTFTAWAERRLQQFARGAWLMSKLRSARDRAGRALARLLRKGGLLPPENSWGWKFRHGSSGPFGEDAPGEWIDRDEALFRWLALRRKHGENFWVDVHATRLSSSPIQCGRQQALLRCA